MKDVYQQMHQFDLSECENFPQNLKNKSDLVVCAGLINHHHMNWNLFEAMILGTKQGGLAVFSASHSYLGHYWSTEVCQVMESEGRFQPIAEEEFQSFGVICPAVGRFFKSPMKVFCYKNLQEARNTWTTREA